MCFSVDNHRANNSRWILTISRIESNAGMPFPNVDSRAGTTTKSSNQTVTIWTATLLKNILPMLLSTI
jgi:hypothetical protein